MYKFATALVCCASIFGSVHASNDQVQRGQTPSWVIPSELMPLPENASGLVFVRRQDFLIHLDKRGQEQYTGYRIKILHPNALQLGNLSISWNPAYGVPTVHSIKIHRDGEAIDILGRASFEILRREDQLEAAKLDGILTSVLRVADLRVGDELEFAFTIRASDPSLGNKDSGLLVLLPNPPAGRFHLGVSWLEGQEPQLKLTPDMAAIAKRGSRSVDVQLDNPGALIPPKDAPPRYQWQRVIEYSDFPDWNTISQSFAPLYRKAAALSDKSPIKAEAKRIAAANARPIDRASAALKLVQQDVRYIYIGLNAGNLTPTSADETWQRRYGDCKAKTALLLALLGELGIEAEAVLANNSGGDDGLDGHLPNPQMLDHVLVRAKIDGVAYWMDGTLPPVVPPALEPALPYRWILPPAEVGRPLERIEWHPAKKPDEITLYEIDARAGFDQPARITNTTIMRGVKGLQQQVQLSGAPPSDILNVLRQQLVGNQWQTIEDVQWHYDLKAQASVLTIIGTRTMEWDDDGGGARSMALPGGGFSPPDKRGRATDQDQTLPYYTQPEYSCFVTTVRLPRTTQAKNWTSKPGFDTHIFGRNYYRAFDLRDGAIRMVRGSRVEQPEIDAATAKVDNGRIASFDNSMAWIFYDPTEQSSVLSSGKAVPATYEIDWAADNVPCSGALNGK